jgi:protein-S-isoprenylcysteine O-methyltransferase Ste14
MWVIMMTNMTELQIRKQAIKYSLLVMMQRVLGLLCFLVAAQTFSSLQGWLYFSLYFLISIITLIVMMKNHQETLSERGKNHENTMRWDKILLAIYVPLSFYGIYIAAGLDVRYNGSTFNLLWLIIGIALFLISSVFMLWPILENKHFESTARIQQDRNQIVITSGPYRIIRHPGYSSIILWAISVPLIFGSILTAVVSSIIVIIIIIRTHLEDTMLQKELNGYREYCLSVKYRLIPYIW